MAHGHSHSHGHELEGVSDRALLWAMALNVGLSAFEVVGGVIASSVALLADALHNFNDCAALFVVYVARRISRREANERLRSAIQLSSRRTDRRDDQPDGVDGGRRLSAVRSGETVREPDRVARRLDHGGGGTPEEVNLQEVRRAVEGVEGVDDLWELDGQHRALEAHVAVSSETLGDLEPLKAKIKHLLKERFSIHHSTLEFEITGCACCDEDRQLVPRHR